MLYYVHELSHAAFAPMRAMAESVQQLYTHPWLPVSYTRFGRAMAAGAELVERTTRRYGKPEFGIGAIEIDKKKVAVTEEVVRSEPFCDLLHFKRAGEQDSPRVLVVAPLSGHYATLLRGTVTGLLAGHDVYITDWKDAREVPSARGGFDLDDYIDYVIGFLRHLGPNTHVLAVCQPSVPVLAATSVMNATNDPCAPASMTLMGGPIDTRRNPTAVNELATSRPLSWFERSVIQLVPLRYNGRGRRVYPGFVQLTGFMSMNLDRHVSAHWDLFAHLVKGDGDSAEQHRKFYDEYLSVMDLPAEFYLQTIKTVFQDHALPDGKMLHRGLKVDPSKITKTALMTVEGENDDITGPGQTVAAHDLCSSLPDDMKRHHLQKNVGHYGVFNGRRWREEILPRVADFILAHDKAGKDVKIAAE